MTGEELTPTADTTANVDAASTPPVDTSEADMGAVFDRLVTNNGADRAANGQFASPNGSAQAAAASPGDGGVSPGEDGAGEAAATPPVAAGTPAPAHLPGAIKSHWDKFPEEARAAIAAHQSEMDRKFGEIGKQFGAVKPIADKLSEAVTKFDDFRGMTPDQLAQGALELAAVQARLNKDPVGTLIEVAKHYNVLPHLAQAFQGQGGDQQLVTGLQQKIANLEAQLSKVSNPDTIRETVSKTLQERETETLVQKFAAEDGKDYWADVEADMPLYIKHVLEKGLAEGPMAVLQKAYDMAINANPDVRAKVRAAEAKATAATPDPKKAAAVRNAVSINVKSSNSGKERSMTEQEAMAAAYDRAMAS